MKYELTIRASGAPYSSQIITHVERPGIVAAYREAVAIAKELGWTDPIIYANLRFVDPSKDFIQ